MRAFAGLLSALLLLTSGALNAPGNAPSPGTSAPVSFRGSTLGVGRTCHVRFRGPAPLAAALADNQAVPLSAESVDADRDGTTDLVAGFATEAGNAVVVFRGDPGAATAGASTAATRFTMPTVPERPFLGDALVTPCGVRPESLATGDFDADGDVDVAIAALGAPAIEILRGGPAARFDASTRIDAGGSVTGLLGADVRCRTGRCDLIVAVDGLDGPRIDVYESSADWGAATSSIAMSDTVTSLDAGYLGGEPELSIVAGAGRSVYIVGQRGPTRVELPIAATHIRLHREANGSPTITASDGAGALVDIAVTSGGLVVGRPYRGAGGNLISLGPAGIVETGERADAALWRHGTRTDATRPLGVGVAMRIDADALPDLVAFEQGASKPTLFSTQGTAPPVVVTNTNDSGPGSLRDAILGAGSQLGGTIAFNIPGDGPFRIPLQTPLPELSDPITIDATTQPGYSGRPLIEIDGSATSDGAGLALSTSGCAARGLAITGAFGSGISVFQASGTVIEADYIGLDPSGAVKPNRQDGVTLTAATETLVGGATVAAANVISGNADIGVHVADGSALTFVFGNRIGTDPTGQSAVPNSLDGVNVEDSPLTTVGAPFGSAGNLVAGNGSVGVIVLGAGSANSLVQGNKIGTDVSGETAVPNGADGVLIQEAPEVLVGGSGAGEGNLVSGNALNGVALIGRGVEGSVVQGNLIGTNAGGETSVANLGNGVYGEGASDFLVGGAASGEGNVISGNDSLGIGLFAGTTGARMHGNLIGPGRNNEQIGNFADGIYIQDSSGNLVGGVDDGEGNTIAYNGATGVFVYSGERNPIIRNAIYSNGWIGIDVGTPAASPNDPGDADGGGNQGLNFPMTTMVAADASSTTVRGVYVGGAGLTLRLEFFASAVCDPFGFGEGETFLGTATIVTDADGKAIFSATLPVAAPAGSFVSSTATDDLGNTSEFSECAHVVLSWDPPNVDGGPPRNLGISATPGRVQAFEQERIARADVTAYKIYRSNSSPVAAVPGNLFTSVPASQTTTMMPASAGGFFAVTACYSDGTESGPSNDANSPGAPVISSVTLKGAAKLIADGSSISSGVLVIADGIPFVSPARLKRGATRIVQKGTLLTGQTLRQYLAGRPVKPNGHREALVGFRNSNGAVTTVVVSE